MCKGKGLWLCIAATLMLTTVGTAQDKGRDPDTRQLNRNLKARAAPNRTVIFVRQAITPLLQLTSKSVGQRYNLDETTVNELRQSIHESVEALLKRPESMRNLATAARRGNHDKMLETLLAQPDCKVAFAKYLNEEQLQDYMDFILARIQRDRGAVARHLTAWLDQQLSLTVDQREKIEQRLIVNADKGRLVDAGDILWNRLRPEEIILRGFKYPPDDVLSHTQLPIWEQLTKFDHTWRIPEHVPEEMIVMVKAKIIEDFKAGKITREAVELSIEFWDKDKEDASEYQEEMRRIAAAKLAAHTEQLGPLEESASQRLTLATKGVVEEYLETQGKDWNSKYEEAAKEIHEAVAVGKMTNQEAAQKLEGLQKRLHAKEHATKSGTDITHHPLYQQTIEDVLSDEVLTQYKARQAERQVFRQQALRDVLVASMDAELFLNDEQRKHFETTFAELSASSATDEVPAPVYMAHQLFQRTNRELLSPWQQEEFERIYRELESELKFVEKR